MIENLNLIAQIIGFIPMILMYLVYYFDDRKKMIVTKIIADVLHVVHYVLLGSAGYAGAAANVINIVRGTVYLKKDKFTRWKVAIPTVFVAVAMISSYFTWKGPVSILPAISTCITAVSYWCAKPEQIRKMNFIPLVMWLIYAISIFSVSGIISNALSIISIINTEIRCRKEQKKGV